MLRERRRIISTRSRGIHLSHRGRGPPLPDLSGCRGGPCIAWKATETMQLGLMAMAMIFLSSMGHSDVLKLSKARRQRRGKFSPCQFLLFVRFLLPQQQSCFSFLWSESLRWMSYKHLTRKVKITFCLFSPHSYLFFQGG